MPHESIGTPQLLATRFAKSINSKSQVELEERLIAAESAARTGEADRSRLERATRYELHTSFPHTSLPPCLHTCTPLCLHTSYKPPHSDPCLRRGRARRTGRGSSAPRDAWLHPCRRTRAFPPLHSLPCMHTHAFTPLHAHPCFHTSACTPLLSHPCMHTHAFTPLHAHPCFHTHACTPMLSHPCFHTHAFTPMHAHRCIRSPCLHAS